VGIVIKWNGKGVDEKGYDSKTGQCLIEVDSNYFRPAEVDSLLGDSTKAKEKLGWVAKTSFSCLVSEMVNEDLILAERDSLCVNEGFKAYSQNE
jgi:GDPmannose 4,6-dehydratase